MEYKPYSLEWSRKRYLSEAIQKYFEDDVSTETVVDDIVDILYEFELKHKSISDKFKEVRESILRDG